MSGEICPGNKCNTPGSDRKVIFVLTDSHLTNFTNNSLGYNCEVLEGEIVLLKTHFCGSLKMTTRGLEPTTPTVVEFHTDAAECGVILRSD